MHPRKGVYGAGCSKDGDRVIEPRNRYSGGQEDNPSRRIGGGKPTVSSDRKAAVLSAVWRGFRTPPGSESGACIDRGNSGTWESHPSPGDITGQGDRLTKGPGAGVGASTGPRAGNGTTKLWKRARYREASAKRSDPKGVVGSRSGASYRGEAEATAARERGEPRPKGPTGGKAPPGITFWWTARRERP